MGYSFDFHVNLNAEVNYEIRLCDSQVVDRSCQCHSRPVRADDADLNRTGVIDHVKGRVVVLKVPRPGPVHLSPNGIDVGVTRHVVKNLCDTITALKKLYFSFNYSEIKLFEFLTINYIQFDG